MADQQYQYFLGNTYRVLGLPPLCTQTHPAVQLCTPTSVQTSRLRCPKVTPESAGEHTTGCHKPGDSTAGGKGSGPGGVRVLDEAVAGTCPPHRISDSVRASWRRCHCHSSEVEKHLNSKKTTVDTSAYILFCNKYLQGGVYV